MTDLRIALHEAAHAVTGEILHPGCISYVDMAPPPAQQLDWASSMGLKHVDAYCRWELWDHCTPIEYGALCYAGKWAEIQIGEKEWKKHVAGDMWAIRECVPRLYRSLASKYAKSIVTKNWSTIISVAMILGEKPITFGDDIREVIRAGHA